MHFLSILHPPSSILDSVHLLPDELRLAIAIAVNVFVFIAAFRFVRRFTSQDPIGASLDALLIHYVVQYLAVCLPGLVGVFNATTMLLIAIALGAVMLWADRRARLRLHIPLTEEGKTCGLMPARRLDFLVFTICLLFVLGFFCGLISTQSVVPLVGDDAMTYHLPAAGYWMQTGRLALYNTWFFNPANTYSPLAGSTFLLWLIAPIGADLLAQFAQMPALILAFLAIVEIARSLGVSLAVASISATAAVLSRPFVSEAIIVKDDHFLAAFFIVAIAGCTAARLKDRLGPSRIGLALGLFFATKYTAILTAPLLLLVIDAPIRAKWSLRQWGIAVGCAVAVAGPWYLRNWIIAGNPLYPVPISIGGLEIFKGMFIPQRSTSMRTLAGAWKALSDGYNSPSPLLVCLLGASWIAAMMLLIKRVKTNALLRVCLIGPVVGLLIFFFASHAALIRYASTSLLLLFICVAIASGRLPLPSFVQISLVSVVAIIAIYGSFEDKPTLEKFTTYGIAVLIAGMIYHHAVAPQMRRNRTVRLGVIATAGLALTSLIFVFWHSTLEGFRFTSIPGWSQQYPENANLWKYIDEHVPADAQMAYTNLVFTRPLLRFSYTRRVVYIPTRAGVRNYHDLPSGRQLVPDEGIREFVAKLLTDSPDERQWREKLLASGVEYLLVGRQSVLPNPPEEAFADNDPAHFHVEFKHAAGILYRITR